MLALNIESKRLCSGMLWVVGNLNFFFLFPDRTERWFDQAKLSRTVSCCAKNWCSSPSFHVQSQISDSLASLKNSTPSRSYHTSRDSAIYTNYPTTLYGIFEEGLGAPSALAFGRPESGITWAPAEKARPTNPMMAVFFFVKGDKNTVGFSRHGPIFNLQSKPRSSLGRVQRENIYLKNHGMSLRSETPTK